MQADDRREFVLDQEVFESERRLNASQPKPDPVCGCGKTVEWFRDAHSLKWTAFEPGGGVHRCAMAQQ
jgi:hypothetical protein